MAGLGSGSDGVNAHGQTCTALLRAPEDVLIGIANDLLVSVLHLMTCHNLPSLLASDNTAPLPRGRYVVSSDVQMQKIVFS